MIVVSGPRRAYHLEQDRESKRIRRLTDEEEQIAAAAKVGGDGDLLRWV